MSDKIISDIFTIIQQFLKNPPVIIWGSGATIPFNLPSMSQLNDALKKKIADFNATNENLENELGKDEYKEKMPEIRRVVWDTVNQADKEVHEKLTKGNFDDLEPIKNMIEKFRDCQPRVVNIITTNYDCILEYTMAYHTIPFTDGFSGRDFSTFSDTNFKSKNLVHLIKVHGSLNWFKIQGSIRFLSYRPKCCEAIIICPGRNKYQEAYQIPYRNLIQKSDDLIQSANSFLVVGFGFNDEHLTPKIREKVNAGTPLVLVTRGVTESCEKEMTQAQKYIFLQKCKESESKTLVTIKKGKEIEIEEKVIDGNYWQLKKFMEVL